jgi:hypothetical protein
MSKIKNNDRLLYTFEITKGKKVVVTKQTWRRSRSDLHRQARQFFAANADPGMKMTVVLNKRVIEEYTMDADGWDFTVLDGETVADAIRKAEAAKKSTTAGVRRGRRTVAAA